MMQPYLPGATFIDLGPDGGQYDETAHAKGCIHTTEGSSLAGAEAAYAPYPPHLGYDPGSRVIHQYVRLDRYSMAFKGAESDDEFVIQVEVVGFAAKTHTYSQQWYRNIGEDIIRPLRQIIGIPDNFLTFYGEGDGIVLASPASPIRLSSDAFRNYRGWLGHQHVPAPDEHWDPGRFRMAEAISYSLEDDMSAEAERKIQIIHAQLVGDETGGANTTPDKYPGWPQRDDLGAYDGPMSLIDFMRCVRSEIRALRADVTELKNASAADAEAVEAAAERGTDKALEDGTVKVAITIAGNPTIEGGSRV